METLKIILFSIKKLSNLTDKYFLCPISISF